jgi:pilus assembly protein Flp/PilA
MDVGNRASTDFPFRSEKAASRLAHAVGRGVRQGKGGVSVLTFIRDDEGQGLVEYALIIAVIAIAVIVAMIFLRGQIQNIFSNIGNNLT